MNKGIWFLVLTGVVIAVGCSKQKEAVTPAPAQEVAMQQQAQVAVQQAQAVAQQANATADQASQAAEQAKATADQAAKAADQAKVNAQVVTINATNQIQDLLAKAKAFFDSGKFDDAIAQAQEVLKLDVNNTDAKGIIETAKAKITAMAQQKMADVKQGLADKFGAMTK